MKLRAITVAAAALFAIAPAVTGAVAGERVKNLIGKDLTGWKTRDQRNGWRVEKGVLINSSPSSDLITGSAFVKQTDWKMKPFSALFGTLKVADVVEVSIDARVPAAAVAEARHG